MIDLSKLPAPQIVEELDFEEILGAMRVRLEEILPEWTAAALESDPANKVLEVAAYRELLVRQRVNEAARACMLAFALGSDLEHMGSNFGVSRVLGTSATFTASISLSVSMDVAVKVPQFFTVVSSSGEFSARLLSDVFIPKDEVSAEGVFELVRPGGCAGNALLLSWVPITPLPFVVSVTQVAPSSGGGDDESDDALRGRIPLSMERFSTAGPRGAYEYFVRSADVRIRDVRVLSPNPGEVDVVLLSQDGNGEADDGMILRVRNVLVDDDDKIRPLDDLITVKSAEIVCYEVEAEVEFYPGVVAMSVFDEVQRQLFLKTEFLREIGKDVKRSALIAAAHVEGVKCVILRSPAKDVSVGSYECGFCSEVRVTVCEASEE